MSTWLTLKRKRHMYYMPMDFDKLTLDGLIDTGALTSAISEQDLNKIKLLANEAKKDTGPPPIFPYLSMQLKPDMQVPLRQATPLFAENTYTLQPGETLAIASRMPHLLDHDATGIVTPSPQFESHDSIFITSSLITVNNNAIGYQIINFSELPYTIVCDTHLADFKILTPEQL